MSQSQSVRLFLLNHWDRLFCDGFQIKIIANDVFPWLSIIGPAMRLYRCIVQVYGGLNHPQGWAAEGAATWRLRAEANLCLCWDSFRQQGQVAFLYARAYAMVACLQFLLYHLLPGGSHLTVTRWACAESWVWRRQCFHKGPQLRTWSSWGPNCWNGPHLVLILHKSPHFTLKRQVANSCRVGVID